MLEINKLRDYTKSVIENLKDAAGNKMFNYTTIIIDNSELANVLEERKKTENTFLISIMPDFKIRGSEDNAKWNNSLMFLVLDKTSYSDKNREEYIDIFVQTQEKAQAFIYKLLEDKGDSQGMFCGFLTWLEEDSIAVSPVWKSSGCNGWMIEVSLDSRL